MYQIPCTFESTTILDDAIISQPGFMQDIEFCQHVIDLFPEPCFLVFDDKDSWFLVNSRFIKLLKYSSFIEFYHDVKGLHNITDEKNADKILSLLSRPDILAKNKFFYLKLTQKNGRVIERRIQLNGLKMTDQASWPAIFGRVLDNDGSSTYKIDRSLLNLFNNDKFLDEAMVILDFEGNIISANRKLLIINFFADLSDRKFNLFTYIDNSYKDKLNKRISDHKKGYIVAPAEYKLLGKNNRTAYIEIYSKTAVYNGNKVIVALIRDITINKETEKKLLYTIVQTEEKERQRFAQDLHDELGPFLSGLKLYINELQQSSDDPENKNMLFSYLHQMIDEAVDKIRNISSNLTPQNMIDEGLSVTVNKMISKLSLTGQYNINFSTSGEELKVEHSFIITLYRIILELLNNSIKHASCKNMTIKLDYKIKTIRLVYSDDGRGFDLKKQMALNRGIGLKSILNRIELYQGKYSFRKLVPKGFIFEMTFPSK